MDVLNFSAIMASKACANQELIHIASSLHMHMIIELPKCTP